MNQKAWNKKRAVVSGGSSGLGRFLALELARHGAEILILGRDRDRLTQVAEEARGLGASFVDTCSIDLLNANLDELASTYFGTQQSGIDLLINAVGQSDRGYLAQLNELELIDQFRMNVIVTHRVTRICLPLLKKTKGCIVNIGSLASKVAAPCLGGYAVSKSALSAYSQQLRMELRSDGVHVLMVCPGPIQRDDGGVRYNHLAEQRELAEQFRKPAGGAPLKTLDPVLLAREVVDAASSRSFEVVRPGKVRWLAAIMALWPAFGQWILDKNMSKS